MMGAENISLGTCSVTYNSVDLGLTIGGVEVEVTTETHETKVDQFGETVVGEIITGRNIMAKVPMAETTLDNLVAIMPGATKTIDGTDPTTIKVEVATGVGTSLFATAKVLVLHPIANLAGDLSEDLTIPLAATPGGINFAYRLDQERVYVADFKGYPNATGLLFVYGDQSAAGA
jgi:hypothetical protein